MEFLERVNRVLIRILMIVGGCFLVGMILLTCANIFFRIVWLPVRGTFELMGFFGAIIAAFALGYTQVRRGHIAVDILVNSFSKRTRRILDFLNSLICMLFFGIVSWQIATWATTLWETGEVSETLQIIFYPFVYAVALGFAILTLVLLVDFLKSLFPEKENVS